MNLRERLKEAYENVSFSADKTWTNSPNAYHNTNLELYLTEHHVQKKKLHGNRPRTVRECIPKSRLAQYSNYVYNESREMSYASSTSDSETTFSTRVPTEPWEMPEVGELFRWFLKNLPEDSFSRPGGSYESPLLSVNGFEDKILKIQITEDRVKNIWNKDQFCERATKTSQIVVSFFTSPMKNFFLFNGESDCNHEWFRNVSSTRDYEQLEQLSNSFQEQSNFISKFLAGNHETVPTSAEPVSTEILYSEVLQGLSPSRKFLSSFKSEQSRGSTMDDSSTNQDSFTNYTILNSQRTGQEESVKNENFSQNILPKVSQFSTSNQFESQKLSNTNAFLQNVKHSSNRISVDSVPRSTRTSIAHPLSSSYVQQTYFYSPVQTVQRWMPSFTNNYYPTQIFTTNWFSQNPVMPSSYDVNRIFGAPPINTAKTDLSEVFSRRSNFATFDSSQMQTDLNQYKEPVEIDPFNGEHQVSTSISEELEIQALEQYNSNENFYQELERQAAEQYANSPE